MQVEEVLGLGFAVVLLRKRGGRNDRVESARGGGVLLVGWGGGGGGCVGRGEEGVLLQTGKWDTDEQVYYY